MNAARRFAYPAALFLLPLVLYLHTMLPTVGFQDSGYYLAAVNVRGVTYPTGYPLYMVLAMLFSSLPINIALAVKVHLLSALSSSLAAVLTFYFLRHLLRAETALDAPRRDMVCAAAALALVCGRAVWAQSINAEVYALQLLLTAAFWLVLARYLDGRRRALFPAAAALALMLANHPISIVSLLFFIGLLIARRRVVRGRDVALAAVLLACLTAALYSYLPLRSAALRGAPLDPLLNWGLTARPANFLRHVLGSHWTAAGHNYSWRPGEYGSNLLTIIAAVGDSYYPFFLGLALFGLWRAVRGGPRLVRHLAVYFCAHVLFIAVFSPAAHNELVNYCFPAFFAATALVATAALDIAGRLADRGRMGRAARRALPFLLILLLPLPPLLVNVRALDRRDYWFVRDLGENMLRPLEKDAVVLLAGDVPNCAALYFQQIEGRRRDVLTLCYPLFARFQWYRDQLRGRLAFEEKGVLYPDLYVMQLLERNPDRVFYIGDREYFDAGFYRKYQAVPAGYLYRLTPRGRPEAVPVAAWELKWTDESWLTGTPAATSRAEEENLRDLKVNTIRYYIHYLMTVDMTGRAGLVADVLERCRRIEASVAAPRPRSDAAMALRQRLFAAARTELLCDNAGQAIRLMNNLLVVDPRDSDAFLYLGNIYYELGQRGRAGGYYRRLLAISPNHSLRAEIESRLAEGR